MTMRTVDCGVNGEVQGVFLCAFARDLQPKHAARRLVASVMSKSKQDMYGTCTRTAVRYHRHTCSTYTNDQSNADEYKEGKSDNRP